MTPLELVSAKSLFCCANQLQRELQEGNAVPRKMWLWKKWDVSTSSKHVFNEERSGGVEKLQQFKGVIGLGWQQFIWEGPAWGKDRNSPGTGTESHFSMARPSECDASLALLHLSS